MKVLAVIVIPPHLDASGAVNAGMSLSKATADICDIELAIMSTNSQVEKNGNLQITHSYSAPPLAPIISKLPNKVRSPLYQSTIPKIIQEGNYDLVHIHNPLPTLEMKRIAQACISKGIPYVVSTHGFVEVTSGGNAYGLNILEKAAWKHLISNPLDFVVKNAALLFPTSPNDVDILKQMQVEEDRMVLVTNGVNPQYYQPIQESVVQDVRRRFSLDETPTPICFFLGNHTANKGIHVLIEAFEQVKVPFTGIIGGKLREGVSYPDTEIGINEHGQRFICTDRLEDEEVRALYAISDLFVFPTLSDTLPLVILEAMASGLPVLSTMVGGIPYQVTEGCGILVPPNDSNALSEKLELLFNTSSDQLKEMGDNSKKRVEELFDWRKSAKVAVEAYEKILDA